MLPAPEYEYAGQSLHVDADVAAEAVPYFPSLHGTHNPEVLAPISMEYVPCTQSLHVLLFVAPDAVEYVPIPHDVQDVLPLESRYCPEGHFEQAVAASTDENVPHSHLVQVVDAVAPVDAENFPATHKRHPVSELLPGD